MSNNSCRAGAIVPGESSQLQMIGKHICMKQWIKQHCENNFVVESKVVNSDGVPVAGCVLDQQRIVSNSHASNA